MSDHHMSEQSPLISQLGPERPQRHLGVTSAVLLNVNRMIGTGIFSIPSGIYALVGSVGWSLILWSLGAIIVLSGFSVYLEYGLEMPHTGGEMNYLSRVYRKPKYFATVTYAMAVFLLEFSATNSYAFGLYLQLTFGIQNPSDGMSRIIACVTVVAICFLHAMWPNLGKHVFNFLGIFKLITLVIISIMGLAVMGGLWAIPNKPNNFDNMFGNDGMGGGAYGYATALLRISYSYRGWETVNSVLGEVKNPHRTMLLAGPISIIATVGLYLLCNMAYFAVIPKDQIRDSGAIIAGKFFEILLGKTLAARVLPFCVCMSNLGNILVVSFACARIVAEFGHHHIVPFSELFATLKPRGAPTAGLALHALSTCLVVLIPPNGEVYEFIVDLSTYPVAVIGLAITIGLLWLHKNSARENWGVGRNKWHSHLVFTLIFLATNLFLVVAPWIPPPEPKPGLPYYAYPLGSVAVFVLSGIWWLYWRDTDSRKIFETQFCQQQQEPEVLDNTTGLYT